MPLNVILGTWWPKPRPLHYDGTIVLDFRERSISRFGKTEYLSPMLMRMTACLVVARSLSYGEIIDALYCDDPNGGPVDASGVIKVMMHKLREQMNNLNIVITTRWGHGFEIGGS